MSEVVISFVVPAYNEEVLIASCLYAITAEIARTGCPAEIIVVNNNSTDRTREIALSVSGVAVVDEPQRGLVQARRAGCFAARGRLIANIDADTMVPEGWLDMVLAEFARLPGLVALSGPFIHYDVPRPVQIVVAVFYRFAFTTYLLVRFVFRAGSMMQGGNFVILKSALDSVDAFNPDFSFFGEDTELARQLSKVGSVKFSFDLPAFSAVGAVLLAVLRSGVAGLLMPVLTRTTQITSMIFLILIGATLFSLVFRGLSGDALVERTLTNLPGGVGGATLAVMAALFVLGFVMDAFEIIFVVVPIVAPVLLAMPGIDPVWLGVMMAVNLQTSYMHPPLGPTLFYLRGVAPPEVTTRHIYLGIIPFVLIQLAMLVALWFLELERQRLGGKNTGGDSPAGACHLHGIAPRPATDRRTHRRSRQPSAAA